MVMPTLEDFAKIDLESFLDSLNQEELLLVINYLKDKGVI
jgi:hypothetical protein